jgi:hypothetical protein
MPAPQRRDWSGFRSEFIASDETLRGFAEKRKLSRRAVREHARKEGWLAEREEFQAKRDEKVKATLLNDAAKASVYRFRTEAEINERQHRGAGNATAIINNKLIHLGKKGVEDIDPLEVKHLLDGLKSAIEQDRASAGLRPAATRIELTGKDGEAIITGVILLPQETDE